MRQIILMALALVAAVFAGRVSSLMGSGATHTVQAAPGIRPSEADRIRRISLAEAQDGLNKQTIVLVDVRSQSAYRYGHIPGAVNVPGRQVGDQFFKFPRNKLIVFYCT